jgi:hypothetical protein
MNQGIIYVICNQGVEFLLFCTSPGGDILTTYKPLIYQPDDHLRASWLGEEKT